MKIENARTRQFPAGEYVATMTKPADGRIYSETFGGARSAIDYAKEAVSLGWNVEVIGPDSRIYFIGGNQ